MFFRVLELLFGCAHNHYSFPITMRKRSSGKPLASSPATYVVCLDCGKEMPYDWKEMRVGSPKAEIVPVSPFATKEAA
jgi:hypothetical protein